MVLFKVVGHVVLSPGRYLDLIAHIQSPSLLFLDMCSFFFFKFQHLLSDSKDIELHFNKYSQTNNGGKRYKTVPKVESVYTC